MFSDLSLAYQNYTWHIVDTNKHILLNDQKYLRTLPNDVWLVLLHELIITKLSCNLCALLQFNHFQLTAPATRLEKVKTTLIK